MDDQLLQILCEFLFNLVGVGAFFQIIKDTAEFFLKDFKRRFCNSIQVIQELFDQGTGTSFVDETNGFFTSGHSACHAHTKRLMSCLKMEQVSIIGYTLAIKITFKIIYCCVGIKSVFRINVNSYIL